ncbi:MAG: hypothetical protein AAGK47_00645, partial [Bacteroidota bacterium]
MKHLYLSLLLCSLSSTTALLAQCVQGDCINGRGIYNYPSGAHYNGDFRNGEIHGVGVCYYSDGSNYRGNWKNRYPDGHGIKTYADGSKYKGLWKKGFPVDERGNVLDELVAKNGGLGTQIDVQTGCLQGDCKTGVGVYAYADGSKYEGAFEEGKIQGNGTFTFPNGDKYIGQFKAGYSHGEGTLYHSDGKKTVGQWHNGEYVNDT